MTLASIARSVAAEEHIPEAAPRCSEESILAAASRCVSRWGVSKTTLDAVAREARCGRATVYRSFPGGRDALLRRLLDRETTSFFGELDVALGAAATLQELVEDGVVMATVQLATHPVLQFAVRHDSALVPAWGSKDLQATHDAAASWAARHLARFLRRDDALHAADWLVRAVLALAQCDSARLDPTRPEAVRRMVQSFVLPGLLTLQETSHDHERRRTDRSR